MQIQSETIKGLTDTVEGFIAAMHWTDIDNPDLQDDFDDNRGLSIETHLKIIQYCANFIEQNQEAISRYFDLTDLGFESLGHDLWLTSQGHGAGFWDRHRSDGFRELCQWTKDHYLCNCVYMGDDGFIYIG